MKQLLHFLDHSPTAWHAVSNAKAHLKKLGFHELLEGNAWKLKLGGQYFVSRNGSSLCAFILPKKMPSHAIVLASHTDSPGYKLKPNAEFSKENMTLLGVEVYGGPLITSWLNRDLGIAGRVTYLDAHHQVQEALVRLDEHPVVLPQLAIHLDREVNDKGLLLNKQEQLAVLADVSEAKKASFLAPLLKKAIGKSEILSSDLFLFPLEPASLIGGQKHLLASYRIDSLVSVHAILTALEQHKPSNDRLKVALFLDHEEVGSNSAQGAASPFFNQIFERIAIQCGLNREELFQLQSKSLCLSVDLGHALHPNYKDRHDPQHTLLMGQGVVLKYNAQQKYASDARTAGQVIALCKKHKIPYQSFVNRGDIACGSTIGPVYAHVTGMATVDIGIPQLSMHSARELVDIKDYSSMVKLLSCSLN